MKTTGRCMAKAFSKGFGITNKSEENNNRVDQSGTAEKGAKKKKRTTIISRLLSIKTGAAQVINQLERTILQNRLSRDSHNWDARRFLATCLQVDMEEKLR